MFRSGDAHSVWNGQGLGDKQGVGPLEAARGAEGTDDGSGVLVLGVHRVVKAANIRGGEFISEIGEGRTKLGKFGERRLANDGDGVVGREVVAVVLESDKAEGINEAVGRVAGDDVHLMIDEGTINKAEVHDFGRSCEMEIVAVAPAAEAVGALEKFVADARAPLGGKGRNVGDFLQMEILRVIAADDHGESVFEAEGLSDFEMEALGVELFDAMVNGVRIALRGFVEDGGESGAGVLDVKIELAGFESFVDEERAAEIRLALDGDAGFGFNVLGEKFGILASMCWARSSARMTCSVKNFEPMMILD